MAKSWMSRGNALIASVLISALGVAACGSDPDKAAEFTKSFQTALMSDQDTKYSAAEARCVAKPLVVALTVKQLEAKKITPKQVAAAKDLDDLDFGATASQATSIADEIVRCVDLSRKLLEAAEESNPDQKPDAKAQNCLRDNLKANTEFRDELRDSIEQGKDYQPDREASAQFVLKTLGDCDLALYPKAAYVESGLKSFDAESEDNPLSEKDAECIIGGMIDVITPEKLGREGIAPEAFEDKKGPNLSDVITRNEAEKVAAKFEGCIDLIEFVRQVFDQIGLLGTFPPAFADCFFDALENDPKVTGAFRDAFVAGFLGDEEAASNIDFNELGRELGAGCVAGL